MTAPALIIEALRTPRAKRNGSFATLHPVDLAAIPLTHIIQKSRIDPRVIDDVILGCVSQRGEQDNVIARKAVLAAGLPEDVPGITVNRFCGSALSAINWAAQSVMSEMQEVVLAGGVEHMTRVPMDLDFYNGISALNKRYPQLIPQGLSAEKIATKYELTRKQIDEFAYRSQVRAARAWEEDVFKKSVIPVTCVDAENKNITLTHDDHRRPNTTMESLATLKPVFKEGGVITAGNASGIVDGAAAVLITSKKACKRYHLKPRARIISTATTGSDPILMLLGPIEAINKALLIAKLDLADIDLFEINEAFAPVPMVVCRELKIPMEKVNVNGGAIAMGHPLGATGAMLMTTLLDELERRDLRYGLVTLCTGFGMAVATIIDRKI